MVGIAELPLENTFVFTGALGISGFTSGRSSLVAARVTFGA